MLPDTSPGIPHNIFSGIQERDGLVVFTINWVLSKGVFANFASALISSYSQNDFQRLKAPYVQALIYDMGHSGRGFDDFPREIQLSFPGSMNEMVITEDGFDPVVTVSFSQLYGWLISEIVNRLETLGMIDANPEIDVLKTLVGQFANEPARITLRSIFNENCFQIADIACNRC